MLDLIATTLLEVETLDAEQINHLKDHGTLPDRPYEQNGNGSKKRSRMKRMRIGKRCRTIRIQQARLNDPSIGDLPKENAGDQPFLRSMNKEEIEKL